MGDRGREDRKGRGKGKGKRKISPPRSFLEVGAYDTGLVELTGPSNLGVRVRVIE